MTTLRFSDADAARCRFAISPLWETHAAVRVLYGEHRRPLYQPWIARRRRSAAAVDLSLLLAAQPQIGYAPDFLSPPPIGPTTTVEAELARVGRTPLRRVARELARCRDQEPANPGAGAVDPLVRQPRAGREAFVAVLQRAWTAVLAPDWPKVQRILADDVAYRGEGLTRHGLAGLFADLHPGLAWQGDRLEVARAADPDRDLAGEGLLLVPSAFNWPHVSVVVDPPYQPTLVYPARGAARLWTDTPPPPDRLARLLGRSRATILAALDQPTTTTALAHDQSLSLATVSEHLAALYDGGLANKRRSGRQIRYWRSSLGQALVDAVID